MRGWQRRRLAVWLLALVPGVAAAASLFDLPSGDQSVARLVAPFAGDSASGQIATLFGGLNAAILFLGSIVAGYGILSGIAQTAHDGEMLGRRFSSLWVPIRVAIGLAAIVPLGNGLCGAQVVVNQVAQMGIGVGANIWSQYVAHASPDASEDYVLPDLSGVRNLALGLYMSHVCKIGYERFAATETTGTMGLETTMRLTEILPRQYAYGTAESPSECGGFVVPDYAQDESGIGAAQQAALNILIERMATLAATTQDESQAVDKAATDAAITSAVDDYRKSIAEAARLAHATESGQQRHTAVSASSDGWMMAGAYFASAARTVAKVNAAAGNIPKSVPPAHADPHGNLSRAETATSNLSGSNQGLWASFRDKASSLYNGITTSVQNATSAILDPNLLTNAMREHFDPLLDAIGSIGKTASGTGNPITNLQNLGFAAIGASVAGLTGAILVGIWSTTGGLIVSGLSLTIMGFGVVNAYYLPILPALTYYGAVIGWFILYIECLVAAPIWALMHIRFDGDGMTGSAGSGYRILLNMFLRPSLITIGFGIAMSAMEMIVHGWNLTFAAAFESNFSTEGVSGIVNRVVLYFVYVLTMIPIIHRVLRITTIVPEAVSKWIGGGHDSFGSESGEHLARQSHAGVQVAAGAMAGVAAHAVHRNLNRKKPDSPEKGSEKTNETPNATERGETPHKESAELKD